MDNIIEQARAIGKAIQKDERYLKTQLALQAADEDKELQDLIGQYNLKRMSIQNEMQKPERDEEKLRAYQTELNSLYETIMKNPRMIAYNEARKDFDLLLRRVDAIISQSANGVDPDTADYQESSCSGNCGSCSGCH
jgi:cell fate (sporulation/competence/biofilm development) regulator YlbF (YheA/YmcA/DUF963 family)